jgi:hypothetical protein
MPPCVFLHYSKIALLLAKSRKEKKGWQWSVNPLYLPYQKEWKGSFHSFG